MGLTLITAPTIPAIGLEESKEFIRVDHTTDDADIDRLAKSAETWIENYTGRALLTQTWELGLDAFPFGNVIRMPKPRLLSIVTVKYDDTDGVETTLASSKYQADLNPQGIGRLAPSFNNAWPTTRLQFNAVRIRFTAGYGAGVADIPEDLKTAILRIMSETYERRENNIVGTIISEVPLSAIDMARQHVAWSF